MQKSKPLSLVQIAVQGDAANRRAACNTLEPRLGADQAVHLATILKALGNPVRLQMLDFIAQGGGRLCACDMERHFDLTQPTISHHLRILRDAGLIVSESSGVWVFHSIDESVAESMQQVIRLLHVERTYDSSDCD